MRVSLGIHEFDIKEVIETYELMSNKYFTHAIEPSELGSETIVNRILEYS